MADEEKAEEDAAVAVAAPPDPEPVVDPKAPPPNKLHEWAAALGIMFALALILYIFLGLIRGASL